MDFSIALILIQDGVTSGAVYALLALALVLVFAVTRVIFIPQGEFVAYGALTLGALQLGKAPGTIWLLLVAGAAVFAKDLYGAARGAPTSLARRFALTIVYPVAVLMAARGLQWEQLPLLAQIAFTLAIITPLGPWLYRVAFEPLADASVLVLLIVSVGVHFALLGLGLVMFGAEGSRTAPFSDARFEFGTLTVSAQSLWVIGICALLMAALYLYFDRSMTGKALRATAVNRLGARLVGIGPSRAGHLAFAMAAGIGALSGVLVAPLTTIYYDSGFLIGLKGFVGAIIGGLASYPIALAGALLVGLIEAYASFWASAYKEVLVFTLIVPVLVWRSLSHTATDEEE